jgi:probable F420-dependent oxidoreductase
MAKNKIKIGAFLPSAGEFPTRYGVNNMAIRLEELGFSSLWVSDHILMPEIIKADYPFAKDGKATWNTNIPWYDSLILLAMAAAVTKKIKLGTAIIVLPLRHPVIFAKQTATIDELSKGRLELGIGAGWLSDEFDALNVDFKTRGKRFEDWIKISRNCWTGAPKSFRSEHYNLPEGFLTLPKPYRKDIPFFIGGHSKYALKRAATLGNGWLPQQSALSIEPSKLIEPIELMRKEAISARKDPKKLKIVLRINQSANSTKIISDNLNSLNDVGVNEIIVDLDWSKNSAPEKTADILLNN